MPHAMQADLVTTAPPVTHDAAMPVPFALLRLGNATYTVGEGPRGRLFFMNDDAGGWDDLNRTLEDGWQEIGARILVSTRDALHDFLHTHMIRLATENASADDTRYDIGGFVWDLRPVSADTVAVRFPLHDWRQVTVPGLDPKATPRERAIAVFLAARPDLGRTMAGNVHAWAKRLAAGALVTPIM
ncbi:hypothetical protein ACVDG3_15140 [Meridianimarinicoccus sp. RP-17]|uniref:hypothetical protein n=1 Tax=Meridianimarinicoccus zhengii TaxID=2056810 RepID=UPI000DAE8C49|nr:hypothetical protein [Phycocomes zhengii]